MIYLPSSALLFLAISRESGDLVDGFFVTFDCFRRCIAQWRANDDQRWARGQANLSTWHFSSFVSTSNGDEKWSWECRSELKRRRRRSRKRTTTDRMRRFKWNQQGRTRRNQFFSVEKAHVSLPNRDDDEETSHCRKTLSFFLPLSVPHWGQILLCQAWERSCQLDLKEENVRRQRRRRSRQKRLVCCSSAAYLPPLSRRLPELATAAVVLISLFLPSSLGWKNYDNYRKKKRSRRANCTTDGWTTRHVG